jgi:hypothetical protein
MHCGPFQSFSLLVLSITKSTTLHTIRFLYTPADCISNNGAPLAINKPKHKDRKECRWKNVQLSYLEHTYRHLFREGKGWGVGISVNTSSLSVSHCLTSIELIRRIKQIYGLSTTHANMPRTSKLVECIGHFNRPTLTSRPLYKQYKK